MEKTIQVFDAVYTIAEQDMGTFKRAPVCTDKKCPMYGKPLVVKYGRVICQADVIRDELAERVLSSIEYKLTEAEEYETTRISPGEWGKRTYIVGHPDDPWAGVKITIDATRDGK